MSNQYYFSTQSGLLYGIVEKEKITKFKKGRTKDPKTIETKKIISEYSFNDDIFFPQHILTTETELKYDVPQGEKRYQQRSISKVELKKEADK